MEFVKGCILLLAWNDFAGVALEGVVRHCFVRQDLHRFPCKSFLSSQVLVLNLRKLLLIYMP